LTITHGHTNQRKLVEEASATLTPAQVERLLLPGS
jgi:hypothetical protein